jgi:hypothetical protein
MKNFRKGEIDGMWLFLIVIFISISVISTILSRVYKSESGSTQERTKVVSSSGGVLQIKSNSAISPVDTQVKIPIKKETIIVKRTFLDGGEPEVIAIKGKYAVTSFDKTGKWEINMYDINDLLVNWVKVTVY